MQVNFSHQTAIDIRDPFLTLFAIFLPWPRSCLVTGISTSSWGCDPLRHGHMDYFILRSTDAYTDISLHLLLFLTTRRGVGVIPAETLAHAFACTLHDKSAT